MSQELQDYIAKAREKGFSDKEIYDQLVASGWDRSLISKLLDIPVPKHKPYSMSARIIMVVGIVGLLIISFIGMIYYMSPSASSLYLLLIIVPLALAVLLLSTLIKSFLKHESKIGSIAIALVIFFIFMIVVFWFG